MKFRKENMLLVHLIIPLIGIAVFIAYYSLSQGAPASKAAGFLEVLAIVFPALIGVVCSMAAETESSAGNYQQMLTSPVKLIPFLSMLTMLLLFGFGAVLLTAGGFAAGFLFLLQSYPFKFSFYILAACILFCSEIFLYVLHLVISLRFGRGASIGIGIVETLLTALMLTGLGYGRWQFIPCAWGVRFISIFSQNWSELGGISNAVSGLNSGILFCICETILIVILACLWFSRWEGRRSEE